MRYCIDSCAGPLCLFLILALAAFLAPVISSIRFRPGLSSDEAHNGNDILEAMETGTVSGVLSAEWRPRRDCLSMCQAGFVFRAREQGLGAPACLRRFIGILTVWGVYFLAAGAVHDSDRARGVVLSGHKFLASRFFGIGLRAISAPLVPGVVGAICCCWGSGVGACRSGAGGCGVRVGISIPTRRIELRRC